MLGTEQSYAFSAELDGLGGILRSFGIRIES